MEVATEVACCSFPSLLTLPQGPMTSACAFPEPAETQLIQSCLRKRSAWVPCSHVTQCCVYKGTSCWQPASFAPIQLTGQTVHVSTLQTPSDQSANIQTLQVCIFLQLVDASSTLSKQDLQLCERSSMLLTSLRIVTCNYRYRQQAQPMLPHRTVYHLMSLLHCCTACIPIPDAVGCRMPRQASAEDARWLLTDPHDSAHHVGVLSGDFAVLIAELHSGWVAAACKPVPAPIAIHGRSCHNQSREQHLLPGKPGLPAPGHKRSCAAHPSAPAGCHSGWGPAAPSRTPPGCAAGAGRLPPAPCGLRARGMWMQCSVMLRSRDGPEGPCPA